jgi:hypothetical protein
MKGCGGPAAGGAGIGLGAASGRGGAEDISRGGTTTATEKDVYGRLKESPKPLVIKQGSPLAVAGGAAGGPARPGGGDEGPGFFELAGRVGNHFDGRSGVEADLLLKEYEPALVAVEEDRSEGGALEVGWGMAPQHGVDAVLVASTKLRLKRNVMRPALHGSGGGGGVQRRGLAPCEEAEVEAEAGQHFVFGPREGEAVHPRWLERVFRAGVARTATDRNGLLVGLNVLWAPRRRSAQEGEPARGEGGLEIGTAQPVAGDKAPHLGGVVDVVEGPP